MVRTEGEGGGGGIRNMDGGRGNGGAGFGNRKIGYRGYGEIKGPGWFQVRDDHPSHPARWFHDRLLRRRQKRNPRQSIVLIGHRQFAGKQEGNKGRRTHQCDLDEQTAAKGNTAAFAALVRRIQSTKHG